MSDISNRFLADPSIRCSSCLRGLFIYLPSSNTLATARDVSAASFDSASSWEDGGRRGSAIIHIPRRAPRAGDLVAAHFGLSPSFPRVRLMLLAPLLVFLLAPSARLRRGSIFAFKLTS